MTRAIVILGAGGHAKVVIDACRAAGRAVNGVLDRSGQVDDEVLGAPVLGGDDLLDDDGFVARYDFHVAICDNETRSRVAKRVTARGGGLATVRHPSAVLADSAEIGSGCLLVAGAVVNADARLGQCVIVNTGASVDHDCILADWVHVAPGARLTGDVICGEGVFVGAGAVVLPGVSLGDHAIIGAGAAVLGDVAAGVAVAGTPARPSTS